MKNLLLTILALAASAAAAKDQVPIGGGFPAVNLVQGQGVRAVLSNVLTPKPGSELRECSAQVKFFDADGSRSGSLQTVRLMPKASAAVTRQESEPGLVRAEVRVTEGDTENYPASDSDQVCTIMMTLQVFDLETGRTLLVVPSTNECLGGACYSSYEQYPGPNP